MAVRLTGTWHCEGENLTQNDIEIPGTVNAAGIGQKITKDTEWISGLYNPFWFEREEYKSCTDGDFHVPFLAQPETFYNGIVCYSKTFSVENAGNYYLFIEISKWKLEAFFDGKPVGTNESLCTPFVFGPVFLDKGSHSVSVKVDNSLQYNYRPDAHTVSDSLGANFNGLCGKVCLYTADEYTEILEQRKQYAKTHPVSVVTKGRNIVINGKATYMRGTHFGGDFPLTGYPNTDYPYWEKLIHTVKDYGFNFIRCHSFCPPESAFLAADGAGVFFQVECGMWNTFNPSDKVMYDVLLRETRSILETFGHHPSFALLSPTNEPGGNWYSTLEKWVADAKEINKELGFEGRRIFTAQSGWFYDKAPKDVTGTDYLYFHRSAYGPIHGGMIRNRWGFNGRDYSASLEGCRLPVISHEMGQWCAYPDFNVIGKYTGCLKPGNFRIFAENAKQNDVLRFNSDFAYCSGKNQVRFLKEEFEANFRTPEITGFEYLDLHDYSGQGTALVGILDPFWDNKGYVTKEEFKCFNSDVVILTRIKSYVLTNTERLVTPVEICNFSGEDIEGATLSWILCDGSCDGNPSDTREASDSKTPDTREASDAKTGEADNKIRHVKASGKIEAPVIKCGQNTTIGCIDTALSFVKTSESLCLKLSIQTEKGVISENRWDITVFVKDITEYDVGTDLPDTDTVNTTCSEKNVILCRTFESADKFLKAGKTVIFNPYLSDLDHDCPSLSIKNAYWNAQMGPRWERNQGLCIDTESPLMKYFPTGKSGGWEWENILDRARAFNFPAKYKTIVRPIDDWNRNFPLSMIFEGKIGKGKMIFVSADLSGSFEERPAAYSLRKALERYASSDDFNPGQEIDREDILRHIKPLYRGCDIIGEILANGVKNENSVNISDINPNIPFVINPSEFPVNFEIRLRKKVFVNSLYVLPIQNDRDFPGVIKDYEITAEGKKVSGTFRNTFNTCQSDTIGVFTDKIVFTVKSAYGMGKTSRFVERENGYVRVAAVEPLAVSLAVLGVDFSDDSFETFRTDDKFWTGSAESRHREIDV